MSDYQTFRAMEKVLTSKELFIKQYVLNRTMGNINGMDGAMVAREGLKAWNEVEEMKKRKGW